ncbi:MAG TPA: bifunctional oligoribonuclease/PAP phosphatase NrnA [Acidimicrobiales bacterium]|nr:bifunctional oligoribonuclease/PAP phosphatase NrnA [Acidimicrobiales bacterium]
MSHQSDLELAVGAINAAPSVALACHVLPDGDALGSLLAMLHLCRANGKPVVASWPEPFGVAPHYRFLPGLDLAMKPADFPEQPDVMITFDCGSADRLGELAGAAAAATQLIVLDHHVSNLRYGTINVVDPDAAATAVVVRRVAAALGWTLTRDAALCLYTGLVTDTGRFQYDNTTPEVFELARELSSFDLPLADITRQLFEEHRFAYIQLVAACLERAQLDHELGFVATWVSRADLDRFGVDMQETEGLIDLIRRTAEAEVSCVAKETVEGVRVSLRSVSSVDVAVLAGKFGGGGHRFAAGFTRSGPVEEVLADVRRALAEQIG